MAELRIAYEAPGWRLMVSTNGLDERPFGPRWPTPKEASRFYDGYVASHAERVSPLRSGVEGPSGFGPLSTPDQSVPARLLKRSRKAAP